MVTATVFMITTFFILPLIALTRKYDGQFKTCQDAKQQRFSAPMELLNSYQKQTKQKKDD